MNIRIVKTDLILLLAATIWGFAFVAQRAGMEHLGPFTYNALRFALGSICLIPFVLKKSPYDPPVESGRFASISHHLIKGGLAAGLILFAGAACQQVGLVYTTAGKAGFITGLYVIFVPIVGIFLKHRTGVATWIGAAIGTTGLFLLSMTETLKLAPGDGIVLVGSFIWAFHVLVIGRYSKEVDPVKLAFVQFVICASLSLICALIFETVTVEAIKAAAIPILYGGIMSAGVAFTLQVVGQRGSPAAHAAIILSLEAVFAGIGGWWILGETLSSRGILGCALMLAGMLVSGLKRTPENADSIQPAL
ncbi:MAG: DMT family transporter [bacterium]|nr:DMT family transporter [bacterium]